MTSVFTLIRERLKVPEAFTMLSGEKIEPGGFGICPICGSGRFQAGMNLTAWTCWAGGCHELNGRDALGLLATAWNISRYDAATRVLGGRLGRLPVVQREARVERPRAVSEDITLRPEYQAWLGEIVMKAQDELSSRSSVIGSNARDYLKKRGLNRETIEYYGLGVVNHWHANESLIPGRRLNVAPGILIPWTGPGGLLGGNVREFHETLKSKYLMVSGSKRRRLYPGGFTEYHKGGGGLLLLVEGEFDALIAQQELAGLVTVKTLGSSTSGPEGLDASERLWISGFTTLCLCFDNDDAGQACRTMWEDFSPFTESFELPEGFKDLNDAYIHGVNIRKWFMGELARLGIDPCYDAGQDCPEREQYQGPVDR